MAADNLREEIKKNLELSTYRTMLSCDDIAGNILLIFEKRIDSRINQFYKNANELEMDWTVRDKVIRHLIEFKEILKE
jgi:hypothetical protein